MTAVTSGRPRLHRLSLSSNLSKHSQRGHLTVCLARLPCSVFSLVLDTMAALKVGSLCLTNTNNWLTSFHILGCVYSKCYGVEQVGLRLKFYSGLSVVNGDTSANRMAVCHQAQMQTLTSQTLPVRKCKITPALISDSISRVLWQHFNDTAG